MSLLSSDTFKEESMSAISTTSSGCPFGYGDEEKNQESNDSLDVSPTETPTKKSLFYFVENVPTCSAC
jgi:hypothetical protein